MSEQYLHSSQYNVTDIQRYLDGKMNASEMHAMEAALDDPFLADAIEGFQASKQDKNEDAVAANLDMLRRQITEKVALSKPAPVRSLKWWHAAAAAIILLISSVVIYNSLNEVPTKEQVAVVKQEQAADENKQPVPATIPESQANSFTLSTSKDSPKNQAPPPVSRLVAPSSGVADNQVASIKPRDTVASDFIAKPSGVAREDLTTSSAVEREVVARDLKLEEQRKQETKDKEIASGKAAENDLIVVNDPSKKSGKKKSAEPSILNNAGLNYFNGRVVDSLNRPLANANVQVYRNRSSYLTDQYGNFRFSSPDTAVEINVTVLGYASQNVRLNNSAPITKIEMQPAANSLSEVVVTSNDTEAKKAKTSSRYKKNYPKVMVQDAEPANGWVEFDKYVEINKKPINSTDAKSGEVVVSFQINQKSELSGFRIEQSLSPAQDAEALRLIKEGPSWRLLKGKKTRVYVIINF